MIGPSHLNAPVSVPYRHKVSAVARIEPVNLNLDAPANPFPQNNKSKTQAQDNTASSRGRYSAQAAAPGFAAHILVEAGLTGDDPFASARGAKAYSQPLTKASGLRLIA